MELEKLTEMNYLRTGEKVKVLPTDIINLLTLSRAELGRQTIAF